MGVKLQSKRDSVRSIRTQLTCHLIKHTTGCFATFPRIKGREPDSLDHNNVFEDRTFSNLQKEHMFANKKTEKNSSIDNHISYMIIMYVYIYIYIHVYIYIYIYMIIYLISWSTFRFYSWIFPNAQGGYLP